MGKIVKVSGPLVVASGLSEANMADVVRVGEQHLIGEILTMSGDSAAIQVYEETSGLGPGAEVVTTGAPLSVELGPGLIENIYDGIQRPLEVIRQKTGGNFLPRGEEVPALDREKKWDFTAVAKVGDHLIGGDVLGTVQETAQWVEYMTAEDGPMAKLRKQNGREKPWRVKYIGVGNESWGCGGNMRPEYYADLYRRYQTYCRNYDGNRLFKIASGSGEYDLHWTETMMKQARNQMDGLSLHYYTVAGWSGSKGSATDFTPEDYYWTMGKCLDIENCIKEHSAVMDKYDPKKRVALMVDEWGTWWDEEPGTIRGHLYQQNTMRDAFVAALSLNVFHKYTDRIKMANIAQIANVLQSMILTKDDKMVLTPSYYVFQMYNVHQDATYLPIEVQCENKQVRARMGQDGEQRTLPMLGATASKAQDGAVHISLSNVDLENSNEVTVDLSGLGMKSVAGRILTCKAITDKNTFEQPDVVKPADFKGAKLKNGKLTVKMPPMSIVALELR